MPSLSDALLSVSLHQDKALEAKTDQKRPSEDARGSIATGILPDSPFSNRSGWNVLLTAQQRPTSASYYHVSRGHLANPHPYDPNPNNGMLIVMGASKAFCLL